MAAVVQNVTSVDNATMNDAKPGPSNLNDISQSQWAHDELYHLMDARERLFDWDRCAQVLTEEHGKTRAPSFFSPEACKIKYQRLSGESDNHLADKEMMTWIKNFFRKSSTERHAEGETARRARIRRYFELMQHTMQGRLTEDQVAELIGLEDYSRLMSGKNMTPTGPQQDDWLCADLFTTKLSLEEWKNVKNTDDVISKLKSLPVNKDRCWFVHPVEKPQIIEHVVEKEVLEKENSDINETKPVINDFDSSQNNTDDAMEVDDMQRPRKRGRKPKTPTDKNTSGGAERSDSDNPDVIICEPNLVPAPLSSSKHSIRSPAAGPSPSTPVSTPQTVLQKPTTSTVPVSNASASVSSGEIDGAAGSCRSKPMTRRGRRRTMADTELNADAETTAQASLETETTAVNESGIKVEQQEDTTVINTSSVVLKADPESSTEYFNAAVQTYLSVQPKSSQKISTGGTKTTTRPYTRRSAPFAELELSSSKKLLGNTSAHTQMSMRRHVSVQTDLVDTHLLEDQILVFKAPEHLATINLDQLQLNSPSHAIIPSATNSAETRRVLRKRKGRPSVNEKSTREDEKDSELAKLSPPNATVTLVSDEKLLAEFVPTAEICKNLLELRQHEMLPNERTNLKAMLETAHRLVTQHPKSAPFKEPVNNDVVEGYSQMIKKPMDLSTIRKRIDEGTVTTLEVLNDHYQSMCMNAILFNDYYDTVHQDARELRIFCAQTIQGILHPTSRKAARTSSRRIATSGRKSTGQSNANVARTHIKFLHRDSGGEVERRVYSLASDAQRPRRIQHDSTTD